METTQVSIDGWIKEKWYIYTTEYYATLKKKKILAFATWIELESIILSEISQRKKYHMISHVCGI